MKQPDYDDDYPTCEKTYSTLRIFSDKINPAEITKTLKINPTESFQKGEPYYKGKLRENNCWFYSTETLTKSKDTRRHIDLILQALNRKEKAINALQQKRCKMDIVSFWLGCGAAGGPALWPYQMLKLGKLGIEIWWDVYSGDEK
jgi:hypothetical protein